MAKFHKSLTLTTEERPKFKRAALEEMHKRNMTIPKLADEIGYSRKTVWAFFNNNDVLNKFLASAIQDYLKLDWR